MATTNVVDLFIIHHNMNILRIVAWVITRLLISVITFNTLFYLIGNGYIGASVVCLNIYVFVCFTISKSLLWGES